MHSALGARARSLGVVVDGRCTFCSVDGGYGLVVRGIHVPGNLLMLNLLMRLVVLHEGQAHGGQRWCATVAGRSTIDVESMVYKLANQSLSSIVHRLQGGMRHTVAILILHLDLLSGGKVAGGGNHGRTCWEVVRGVLICVGG